MKFPLSWLKHHLETTAPVEEIAAALTDTGLVVQGIDDPSDMLSTFTIGKVVAAEKHPDADKLKVCRVETDTGESQIICGAPNARAGITVVVAKPGTYVPGIDTTIQVGKIRGVESHGMMCSMREMQLGEDHDGIIELSSGEVGRTFADWLGEHDPAKVDPVVEISVPADRPDALGIRGIARDLAARGLGTLRPKEAAPVPGQFDSPVAVAIDADTADACPVFCGRLIRGVQNGPSPKWLRDALKAIGLRPISFLVDVTNFFTHDINRPLHVFDAGKFSGSLRVHRAAGGETLAALDERTYTLAPGMVAISDGSGPVSLGGIMGGEGTGVTEGTVDVFLEAAWFDPATTEATAGALGIASDAAHRFIHGVDPASARDGIELATRMIVDHAGGMPSHVVEAGAAPDSAPEIAFDFGLCDELTGLEIAEEAQRKTLAALGFRVEGATVHPPSWRPGPVAPADLVHEIARIASLGGVESAPLPRPAGVPGPALSPLRRRTRIARRTAAALGYDECLFAGDAHADDATLFPTEAGDAALLPGLLRAAAANQTRGAANLALFALGDTPAAGMSGLRLGASTGRDVHGSARPVDVFDAKADLEAVLAAIGAPARAQILRGAGPWWHPGRHGMIGLGPKKILGVFGDIHPRVLQALGLTGPAVAFTLWPAEVPQPKRVRTERPPLDLPAHPVVERDFAFVVDAGVAAQDLVNAAAGADKALIESVQVFDAFEGGPLGEGRKSIAVSVRLRPRDAALSEVQIEAAAARIVEKVQKATGGQLRG
ncbi:YtpR family tRNA-binding protein [Roseivivax sediminis]|uniref:Phenylalanine--tRNA ligase beta subunit n=1 Tax=Roseivivax sediminis TaxID=936889 RepID=A0A1I1W6N4_9RHOB|nr:phenylalanine--tRNA ligase subunit beta [Roseivivax sediminis]SFD90845.1 phenylalanyl-tRNA synthetase beta subunit [Roseivivax sediminis]